MSANPENNEAQIVKMAKAIAAILGVPLALFAVVNSIVEQPLISLLVAFIAAILVSAWVVLSRRIGITGVIIAWLALAVVVLAGFVVWPQTMTVEGLIYDSADNAVTNEEVIFFDRSGRRYETKTDAEGFYQFAEVPSGKYRLRVQSSEVEGETKGILVRVVQQNLAVPVITPEASTTSIAAVGSEIPTAPPEPPTNAPTLAPTNTSTPKPTSTATPAKTPRPTPTPTATIDADPTVYE